MRDIENTLSPEVIQMALANQLPQVAAAFQQKMGEVRRRGEAALSLLEHGLGGYAPRPPG